MVTLALHLLFSLNPARADEVVDREPLWGTLEITDDVVGIAYGNKTKKHLDRCAASFQVRPPVGSNTAVYSVDVDVLTADTSGALSFTTPQGPGIALVPDITHPSQFKSWAYLNEGSEVVDIFYVVLTEGAMKFQITVGDKTLPPIKVENPKAGRWERDHVCTITFI